MYCPDPQIPFTANTSTKYLFPPLTLSLSLARFIFAQQRKKGCVRVGGGECVIPVPCVLTQVPQVCFPDFSAVLLTSWLTPVAAAYPQIHQDTCRAIPINTVTH